MDQMDAKELLDSLMGADRNDAKKGGSSSSSGRYGGGGGRDGDRKPLPYHSREVCTHFLCGFCPHEAFYNDSGKIL